MEASDGTHATIGVHIPNLWVPEILEEIAGFRRDAEDKHPGDSRHFLRISFNTV